LTLADIQIVVLVRSGFCRDLGNMDVQKVGLFLLSYRL
jgi:hypothetical protein